MLRCKSSRDVPHISCSTTSLHKLMNDPISHALEGIGVDNREILDIPGPSQGHQPSSQRLGPGFWDECVNREFKRTEVRAYYCSTPSSKVVCRNSLGSLSEGSAVELGLGAVQARLCAPAAVQHPEISRSTRMHIFWSPSSGFSAARHHRRALVTCLPSGGKARPHAASTSRGTLGTTASCA